MKPEKVKELTLYLNQGSNTALEEIKTALEVLPYGYAYSAVTIRRSMCVSASLYIDLKLHGALVGTFAEFYIRQCGLGAIRPADSYCSDMNIICESHGYKRYRAEYYKDIEKIDKLAEHGTIRLKRGDGGHTFNWYVHKHKVYASDVGAFRHHGRLLSDIVNKDNFKYFEYVKGA